MTIKTFLFTCGLVASGMLSACRLGHNDSNLSIRVINTDDRYQFEASYNRNQTREIERYISRRIKSADTLDTNEKHNDLTVIMADKTTFRIESNPGELKIVLDKNDNSERGCKQVNDICLGIRDLLKTDNKKG